jgi:hypothetical protein
VVGAFLGERVSAALGGLTPDAPAGDDTTRPREPASDTLRRVVESMVGPLEDPPVQAGGCP